MKTSMIALVLAMVAIPVFAHKGRGNEKDVCDRVNKVDKWMHDSLDLTAEQGTKITAINQEACVKLKAAMEKAGGDREKFKPEAKAIMQSAREAWKGVLTPAQTEKMKARAKAHGKGKGGPGAHHGPKGDMGAKMTERMKTELSLTEAQVPQVLAANTEFANRMKGLKEKKDAGTDKETLKKEMKLVREEHQTKLKGILTAEQLTRLEQLREEHKKKRQEGKGK
ncbi:MAG: hypothetical protein JNL57_10600 [Bacteroidetes bacterium]|nr:hypothetical protein [Bacteroidota bacterium]